MLTMILTMLFLVKILHRVSDQEHTQAIDNLTRHWQCELPIVIQ